ncbi:acyl-coenzyme A thioesterase PaaI-like protein [Tenacibaculum lutimaris]|uniref:Acyl-coenzyme A thioesterase PaaI-like protein n=1 Tax=Tenacibaculum lutimaris TaxID=285258 RepID=A0A420DYZ4_9FLAO|nr:DUF4442 domain-containing protein [Tenacibaculum lutimaris]RKF03038.1 acyl-coenzyme A thioesterase PaaI-like protein [Tenacibaculum lutimaris]
MYAALNKFLSKFFKKSTIFKYGFNLSPMYKRSTGKIIYVSDDLLNVKVKIPVSYKNKNYVGSIFGGSLFSATDPIYMIQLINILGNDYVVWDKSSSIKFIKPVYEDGFIDFIFSTDEIEEIKKRVEVEKKIDLIKELEIVSKDKSTVFTKIDKTIYIADKTYYKNRRKNT